MTINEATIDLKVDMYWKNSYAVGCCEWPWLNSSFHSHQVISKKMKLNHELGLLKPVNKWTDMQWTNSIGISPRITALFRATSYSHPVTENFRLCSDEQPGSLLLLLKAKDSRYSADDAIIAYKSDQSNLISRAMFIFHFKLQWPKHKCVTYINCATFLARCTNQPLYWAVNTWKKKMQRSSDH